MNNKFLKKNRFCLNQYNVKKQKAASMGRPFVFIPAGRNPDQ